jgi:hypothetical protein
MSALFNCALHNDRARIAASSRYVEPATMDYAVSIGHTAVMCLLLKHGASTFVKSLPCGYHAALANVVHRADKLQWQSGGCRTFACGSAREAFKMRSGQGCGAPESSGVSERRATFDNAIIGWLWMLASEVHVTKNAGQSRRVSILC